MHTNLAKEWSGEISGTNSGNFFLQITNFQQGRFSGVLRINDPTFGLNVYNVSGFFDGSKLNLDGTPTASDPNTQLGPIRVQGYLQTDKSIQGNWESGIKTGGKFSMTAHTTDNETPENIPLENSGAKDSQKTSEKDPPIFKILGIEVWKIVSGVIVGVLVIVLAAYLIPKLGLNPLT